MILVKLLERIETRTRELREVDARLSVIKTDQLDSDEHFEERVSRCENTIEEAFLEIEKLQSRIAREQRIIRQMKENRGRGNELRSELLGVKAKLEKHITGLKIIQLQRELSNEG